MRDTSITTRGGTLAYTDIGDPDGPAMLFFHGAPTSRLRLMDFDGEFLRWGLRVVSPDRPGYGGSSPQPGRSLADWPTDVLALADELGIDRFLVAGHSSGGPYAVACCALLGDRVTGGLVIGGVTDMAWPGAWSGLSEAEQAIMRLGGDEDAALAWCTEAYGADGGGFFDSMPFELPEPDVAFFANEPASSTRVAAAIEAFRQGVGGYAQDIHVEGQAWPFDPAAIRVPVDVVHGELDTLVPMAHSQHTAELIPGSRLRVFPGHGHFTILSELPLLASEMVRATATNLTAPAS